MAENYVLLETIELSSTTASVTFDNLPSTGYTDLKVVGSFRGTTAQVYEITHLRFNGLTTNLSSRSIEGTGSTAVSFTNSHIYFSSGVGASATSNTFSNAEAYIPNYRSTDYKSVSIDNTGENNASLSYSQFTAGLWSSTAPITSIELAPTGNFVAGSTFSLYAVAATGTTPVTAPFASGGNIVANDGTYWYHAFWSSGTFTPFKALTCDYAVVAGGGSGGFKIGGGGGAGGFRASTSNALLATAYPVLIGAGGAGATATFIGNGTDSSINSFVATGGGYGGSGDAGSSAGSGGSGGGGPHVTGGQTGGTGNTPSTSPSQGNNGGNGAYGGGPMAFTGGGGGAGAVGANATTSNSGIGGAGSATYNSINISTWLSATNSGEGNLVAGGGGGGCNNSNGSPGSGGAGGGGAGGGNSAATAGTVNTGSGGGGGRNDNNAAGRGGSGLVIIRYAMV
jgi:hypothetical protein